MFALLVSLIMWGPASAGAGAAGFEAETAKLPKRAFVFKDRAASRQRAVSIRKGVARRTLKTERRSRKIAVRAKAARCGGFPRMVVKVDGRKVLKRRVRSRRWVAQSRPLSIPAGRHRVRMRILNPTASDSCKRLLRIDRVTIPSVRSPRPNRRPSPAGPPPSNGGSSNGETRGSVAGFHRIANYTDADFSSLGTTASRQRFVVIHSWNLDELRELKAANPDVKVLMYKNLSFMKKSYATRDGRRYYASGVTWDEAASDNPEWILRDKSGDPIQGGHGRYYNFAADVGSRSYQDRWAQNVAAELRMEPRWDGVYLDDVNSTLRYHHDPSDVRGYAPDDSNPATDDEYELAVRSALANVAPKIRAEGNIVIGNVCCEFENNTWSQSLQYLSGARDENWVKYGNDDTSLSTYRSGEGWLWRIRMVDEAERRGKYFLGDTHSTATDLRAMRYGLASLMLASQGRSSFMHGANNADENWFPEYDLALRLGAPTMAYRKHPSGVYFRRFQRGIALVNPLEPGDPASTRFVRLGGGTYSGSGLSRVGSVQMEGGTGLVLERDG